MLRTNKILSELAKLNRTIVNPKKWRKIKEDNLTFVANKLSDTKSELEMLDALEDLKEQRNFTKIYYNFLYIIDKKIVETTSSKDACMLTFATSWLYSYILQSLDV